MGVFRIYEFTGAHRSCPGRLSERRAPPEQSVTSRRALSDSAVQLVTRPCSTGIACITDDYYHAYSFPNWPAVGDRHTLDCRGQSVRRASRLNGPTRGRDPLVDGEAIVRIKSDRKCAA